MVFCRRLRWLVLASERHRRLASLLQRLLAPQPERRARMGLVRSVGLGAVPLRPLGIREQIWVGVAARRRLRAGLGLLDVRPELHRLGADGVVRLLSPLLRLGLPAL